MSKYTEGQINEAIEIVQNALEDEEIYQYLSVSGWSEEPAWMVSHEHEFRAKKKPREYIICLDHTGSQFALPADADPGLSWSEVIKVREVVE